ncbi:Uncharacterised protein [Streptococcus suis]|nr:Uncharacterised protein [Streptococcus suis]
MKTKIKKNGRIDELAIYFIVFNEREKYVFRNENR